MLTQVPAAINQLAFKIVHHHPNSSGIQMFRKRVTRAPADTLGGLGVLSSEDEESIAFEFLGLGSALPVADDAANPLLMNDNQDAPSDGVEFRFLIEPEAQSGQDGWFNPTRGDVFLLWLADDGSLKIPFEIVDIEAVSNLPPFSVRYICNRRDDLLWAVNDLDDPDGPDGNSTTP